MPLCKSRFNLSPLKNVYFYSQKTRKNSKAEAEAKASSQNNNSHIFTEPQIFLAFRRAFSYVAPCVWPLAVKVNSLTCKIMQDLNYLRCQIAKATTRSSFTTNQATNNNNKSPTYAYIINSRAMRTKKNMLQKEFA